MGPYEEFIAVGHYCRWIDEEGRRETWPEAVIRYCTQIADQAQKHGFSLRKDGKLFNEIYRAILDCEIMPSMRLMWSAGIAVDAHNVAAYNCAYAHIDHPRVFDEILYILMCGTGMGFSVERQFINQLPEINEEIHATDTVIIVSDSKRGWASAFRELISLLYAGQLPRWDVSRVRPKGARLKTFGGRASGPEPLISLFQFAVDLFRGAAGRRLNSIECHDLCCKIAESVVVGGVRRSALISLSNLTDDRMRRAKQGEWRLHAKYRENANNSVCYTEKPDFPSFISEWSSLYESYSGERGIFYQEAARRQAARSGRRDTNFVFGTNPCSEIILRSNQFCNLSEVVVRFSDTLDDLRRKVRLATILGTIQSTFTDFKYLRPIWKRNCEEERLLGVSLTGIMDHSVMSGMYWSDKFLGDKYLKFSWLGDVLQSLKQTAIDTNKEYADKLGINQSTAITCVKPSGTVSQLVNCASGIHPRYSQYYIRRVKIDEKDPLGAFMKGKGIPCYVKNGNYYFEFPIESPEGCLTASTFKGMDQLKLWKAYQDHWCEHKPSMTCYYTNSDFFEIGQWIYNNFDSVSGIAFLPYDGHVYEDAPYEPITKEEFLERKAAIPETIDWSELSKYETEDGTVGSHEFACTGSSCDIVDITGND